MRIHQRTIKLKLLLTLLVGFLVAPIMAQNDNPERYVVIKGDTLWSIAGRFLDRPWLWPSVWQQNEFIENPNLIYPGDVLLISPDSIRLMRRSSLQVDKRSPEIRTSSLQDAITTIDPSAIVPFLSQSVILEGDEFENVPYVLQGVDGELILGKYSKFYAKGVSTSGRAHYQLFRLGRPIVDKISQTSYGIEGVYLGSVVQINREGDIATLEVIEANQEIRSGDRLIPLAEPEPLPHYFPHKPEIQVDTRILMIPKGIDEAGRRDIVIISGGTSQQLEQGHVLEVFSDKGMVKDPLAKDSNHALIKLPDFKIATVMVFKAYENVSYAILMESTAAVKVGDRASSP